MSSGSSMQIMEKDREWKEKYSKLQKDMES